MVRLQTLDLRIGVRVPASQPNQRGVRSVMKALSLCLLLTTAAFAQENSDLFDKAPPPIDDALRARVTQFYDLYQAGKFKQAFSLVAEDSQDAFFSSGKEDYKDCRIIKINYSDNFTKAAVVNSCKSTWLWHGQVTPSVVPVTTNWKVVEDRWYWCYVRPTFVRSPFSPNGTVPLPPDQPEGETKTPVVPKDPAAEAKAILAKVSVDKNTITLRADRASKDEVRVQNDMPGWISLQLGPSPVPGLKITASKIDIAPGTSVPVVFEYNPEDTSIACSDCAKRIESGATFALQILPTWQQFPITIKFTDQKYQKYDLPSKK